MNKVIFVGTFLLVALVLTALVFAGYGAAWVLAFFPSWAQIGIIAVLILIISYVVVKKGLKGE